MLADGWFYQGTALFSYFPRGLAVRARTSRSAFIPRLNGKGSTR